MQGMATGIHKQGDHDDQSRRNKEEQEREERELIQAAKRGDVAEVERLISELRVNPDCERVCSRSIRYDIDFKI